jgi:hypothetical protein
VREEAMVHAGLGNTAGMPQHRHRAATGRRDASMRAIWSEGHMRNIGWPAASIWTALVVGHQLRLRGQL